DEHNLDEHHNDAEFIDSRIQSMGDIPLDSLNKTAAESPYDTESEIQFVKRYKPVLNDKETLFTETSMDESNLEEDSDLALILDDEVRSPSAFQTSKTKSEERDADFIQDEIHDLQAFADKPSDTISHLQTELTSLSTKFDQMESNITKKISKEIHSSVPTLINEALKQLPKLLIDALKSTLPTLIPDLFIKPMNKELNALNKLESSRFVLLQKELSKVIRANIRKKVKAKVQTGLSKAAEVYKKANAEGEKWEKNNPESPKDMTETLRDKRKGKGIANEDAQMKQLIPQIEQSGSDPKPSNLQQFSTCGKKITLEEAQEQLIEMKRLADLKATEEKSEKLL
nr:hypothetical protein [Tanacetum cinerariifolium]